MIKIQISAEVAEKTGLLEKPIYNYSGEDISINGRVIKDESATTEVICENGWQFKRGDRVAELLVNANNIILIRQELFDHAAVVIRPTNIKSPKELLIEISNLLLEDLRVACEEYQPINRRSFPDLGPDFDDPRIPEVDEGDVDVLTHFKIVEHVTTGFNRIREDFKDKYGMTLTDKDIDFAERYIDSNTSLDVLARLLHDMKFRDRSFKRLLIRIKEARR